MKDGFELWDTESSNLIGTYPTENAALRVVYDAIQRLGEASVATVALGRENEAGRLMPVAKGSELVQLACRGRDRKSAARFVGVVVGFCQRCVTPLGVVRTWRVTQIRPNRRRLV